MTESQHQIALFQWAAYKPELALMYAIPNGGQRHKAVAAKLKAEGVKAGVPDIHLPLARHGFNGLWIELKKPKDSTRAGKPTKEQLDWLDELSKAGHMTMVCFGWEDAKAAIEDYLS